MITLAIKALLSDRARCLVILTGIIFSVVLINMQCGLLWGGVKRAALLLDFGSADVWVGHKYLRIVDIPEPIPEQWIYRLRSLDGVERVEPYIVIYENAVLPNGEFRLVLVIGCEPTSLLGNAWGLLDDDPTILRSPHAILLDYDDREKLGNPQLGDIIEITHSRARVVGWTRGSVGFTVAPYVFTTLEEARSRYTRRIPSGYCSYFLVKLEPGVDPTEFCARARQRVPGLDVLPKDTYSLMTVTYWLANTGLGVGFLVTVVLGVLIGLGVVGQTQYATVMERLKEYTTLRALGADDRAIAGFLLFQSLCLGVLGSLVGLALSLLIGWMIDRPKVAVLLTWQVAVLSVALIMPVCLLAAWLPYWRIRSVDPVSILRN